MSGIWLMLYSLEQGAPVVSHRLYQRIYVPHCTVCTENFSSCSPDDNLLCDAAQHIATDNCIIALSFEVTVLLAAEALLEPTIWLVIFAYSNLAG